MEYIRFKNFIIKAQYGYTAESTSPNGNKKYLRITDIVPYFVNKERVPLVEIDEKKAENYLVKKDDLLFARTGATTGYNLVVPDGFDNYIFASYLVRIFYDKKQLFPLYVKYVLKSQQWYGFINSYIGGSAQPGMNPKTVGKFQFPYHDISLQKKIAVLLSNYDSLIENNNKRIKLLEKAAEALYKEWFVRFRFPNYKSCKFKKESAKGWTYGNREDGQMIPDSWSFNELNLIASFKRGKNITAANMIEGPFPVISAGLEPSGYHNKANVKGTNLTISSSGANAGFLSYHTGDVWAADCSYYNEQYIWFVYSALNFLRPVIDNLQVGSAQPHVYPKNINKLSTIIPPVELIKQFEIKVKPFFDKIKELEEQNKLLVIERDSLLPRLMSGKLSVEGKEFI